MSSVEKFKVVAAGDSAEIMIYDQIGSGLFSDGVSAKQVAKELSALKNTRKIKLRINSEGGDVFEGKAIYNQLMSHGAKITVYVDGVAASIASLIAMSGERRFMSEGAYMMVHNPWGFAVGNSAKLRKTADLMDSVRDSLIDTYATRTSQSKAKIAQMMDAETWMDANDSVVNGFAHTGEVVQIAAMVRHSEILKQYDHVPAALLSNRMAAEAAIRSVGAIAAKYRK